MSLLILCPHCGERPVEEFIYGEIPRVPDTVVGVEARDIDRGFMLANPEGVQLERWFHAYGCRRWSTLKRDTRTDEFKVD